MILSKVASTHVVYLNTYC